MTEEQKKEEFRELEHQYYQKHMNMGGCSMLLWTDEFDDLINVFYELGLKHGKNES